LQDEIDWADNNGTGMIPDTTPENFCQNRGGFNCRHIAYPVRSANYIKEEAPKEPEAPKEEEVKEQKYTNAKTIEEAKNKMTNLFNDKYGIEIKSVDYDSNLSIEDVNKLNNQLNDLSNDYNTTFDTNTSKPIINFKKASGAYGQIEYTYSGQILKIFFGNGSYDKSRISERVSSKDGFGFKYAGKSKVDEENVSLATLTHEFTHFISVEKNQNNNINAQNFFKELKKLRTSYRKELKQSYNDIDKLNEIFLGDYANTDLNEFMAEGFTEYKLSSKPTKYAKEIGKLIDKYFKK
jgi:aminopeptidase N